MLYGISRLKVHRWFLYYHSGVLFEYVDEGSLELFDQRRICEAIRYDICLLFVPLS